MGKKNRLKRYPQKFGKKFANHSFVKALAEKSEPTVEEEKVELVVAEEPTAPALPTESPVEETPAPKTKKAPPKKIVAKKKPVKKTTTRKRTTKKKADT